jgi:hypothetical protein
MDATQGFTTIDSIVRDECLAQDDLGLHNYMKYLSFAKEGLRDFSLDKKNQVKVIVGQTSNLATLPFPSDYVNWSKIGTVEGDRVKTLIVNHKLALAHGNDECGEPVNNSPYTPNYASPVAGGIGTVFNNAYLFFNMTYDTSTSIYGFGNGGYLNDGQFRVDSANRRFQFSSDWTGKNIYLEYVGTGLNPTGQTVVDENTRKCIKLYIRWQALETNKTASMAEKMRAEQQYWNENYVASKRILNINLDKILGIAREGYKTTNKY